MTIEAVLREEIPLAEATKSSHWIHHTQVGDGFGVIHSANRVAAAAHWIGQHCLFPGSDIFESREYVAMAAWCHAQGRLLNLDSLRHVFTQRFLGQRLGQLQSVCVIGDGRANYVGPELFRRGSRQVISVNLPEILIADHAVLLKSGVVSEDDIIVARSRPELHDGLRSGAALILVPANRANILEAAGIDLFVNIASFQEMTMATVRQYFKLIRSNSAWIYCCNRERKELYGGEVTEFDAYPWGGADVKIFEVCPWHRLYYTWRPPFFRTYDGRFKHALAKF
jgi:hypothetical protein